MADSAPQVQVDFRTEPSGYKHWRLAVDGRVATLKIGRASCRERV